VAPYRQVVDAVRREKALALVDIGSSATGLPCGGRRAELAAPLFPRPDQLADRA
jgi:hypothetical protein